MKIIRLWIYYSTILGNNSSHVPFLANERWYYVTYCVMSVCVTGLCVFNKSLLKLKYIYNFLSLYTVSTLQYIFFQILQFMKEYLWICCLWSEVSQCLTNYIKYLSVLSPWIRTFALPLDILQTGGDGTNWWRCFKGTVNFVCISFMHVLII